MKNSFSYEFTEDELKSVVLFLRKQETNLPVSLEDFQSAMENYLYDIMTLEDIESFFK